MIATRRVGPQSSSRVWITVETEIDVIQLDLAGLRSLLARVDVKTENSWIEFN